MSEPGFAAIPAVPGRTLAFLGFLGFSLFVHLFGFYLFQIVYRDPLNVAPPSASLLILRRGNPADAKILNWIAAEDPAVAASPPSVEPVGLFEARYVPSYDTSSVQPVLPDAPSALPELPPGQTFAALVERAALPPHRLPEPRPAPPTHLVAGRNLRVRMPALAGLPSAPAPSTLEPTRFLVGVTAQGRVAYVFLQSTSGKDAIDALAREHLKKISFLPDPAQPITWSPIAYYWGIGAAS